MSNFSEDGGAFAECFFAQYPLGMGRKPLPPVVMEKIAGRRDVRATDAIAGPTHGISSRPLFAAVPNTEALIVASSDLSAGGVSTLSAKGSVVQDSDADALAETTEKTKEALEEVLRGRQAQKEDFSGRNIRRAPKTKPGLEIVLPGDVGVTGVYDPASIVRSPTRAKKDGGNSGEGSSSSSSANVAAVPFSIGNWKNKRKLIIPLEQRLAQQADTQAGSGGGISEQVMNLAVAVQQARKEVEAEQAAREKARQEEEERRQAEREAEATQRARELLEKAASSMMQTSTERRKESREERLDRIRLERELRERERQQEVRQRRLAKAAARLGITVEALEADKDLLKTVDEAAAGGHGVTVTDYATPSSSSYLGAKQEGSSLEQKPPSLYADDEEDGTRPARGIRKGVFGSAVISNEGIRREMEALARMEEQEGGIKDGIRLRNDDESTDDDDDGGGDGLGLDQLMKKRRRL
ncbi:hypothetical protein C3747_112g96 [Trypanosoma cruzi]|uniref:SKI-interacting protein SKIP SNW domain-containing protein n=2 Tax=Trypanosoma cruzi TaxID=5693 RepID=Q4CR20_TRYCC|nr:hypothetical protein, conserved [Trypanosoma cruzi]EAN82721.1 hypothetical protein, conserved [Trypanosoma cruzi]PWV06656.1 hypothetical protein C3747_112g96 [Trypanosoma cruzi]RNC59002.1 SNW domain-containing protein 1 [Trypanosoma cruzi]|eukprot:XP_804572.1 hypothetical protein [Trypanosoma cruzi strain CL Brener]